jgi:hypothetical protein
VLNGIRDGPIGRLPRIRSKASKQAYFDKSWQLNDIENLSSTHHLGILAEKAEPGCCHPSKAGTTRMWAVEEI